MKLREFYGYFAAAYGTCWFLLWVVAVITQQHIDTGPAGYWGFPAVGVSYAFFRGRPSGEASPPVDELERRVARLEALLAPEPRNPASA